MSENKTGYWVDKAIKELGGPSKAAYALTRYTGKKVYHSAVIGWRNKGRVVADMVMAMSDLSGVSAAKLNPKTHGLDMIAPQSDPDSAP